MKNEYNIMAGLAIFSYKSIHMPITTFMNLEGGAQAAGGKNQEEAPGTQSVSTWLEC